MMNIDQREADTASFNIELQHLRAANEITQRLGSILDLEEFLDTVVKVAVEFTHYRRALVLLLDDGEVALNFGAISVSLPNEALMATLRSLFISTYSAQSDVIVMRWLSGEPTTIVAAELPENGTVRWLARALESDSLFSLPLMQHEKLVGILLFDGQADDSHTHSDAALLQKLMPPLATFLENARVHTRTMDKLASKMRELYILRQIDRELNDTIMLDRVFDMTLDWALRYTNAHAASLALYDERTGEVRYVADLGYEASREQLDMIRTEQPVSCMHRAVRSGRVEVIPDVSLDKDYMPLSGAMHSQMCAPVMREDHVVAVIAIESKKLNAFTDEHIDFVEKLSARAGVAIDNARLFTETVREREKLARIVRNIADIVIVVSPDGKIELVNQAAYAALRLYTETDYTRQPFEAVFEGTPLLGLFQKALKTQQAILGEVETPSAHTYYANLAPYEGIGWIIVMHDITELKETDRLKSELVATVSHDLKQPLSVMHGYAELLDMSPKTDPITLNYARMIQRSIFNMRQLIDDLLDLAKIESGIQFDPKAIRLESLIVDCVAGIQPSAELKAMEISADIPRLPPVRGDRSYLGQIFNNLISNAVKYTPPEGKVHIWAEQYGSTVRIAVQDSGLGISPEDQARIFERFYRVRRPETDSIDGTGLGLAIVKRLVEAHDGQIGLDSELGAGSTFYVTLPVYEG
jgi:two-component system, OmpR family, phosphate regulon sensor histidine kinase PhoR